jgi:hypothetical protein
MELINKSNQFNTTGQRWTHQEWVAGFNAGLRLLAFQVEDKFTEYGIVVVVVLDENTISQFVMSCRVIGLGVEEAVIRGKYKATDANHLCKDLFEKSGFHLVKDEWVKPTEPLVPLPHHITLIPSDIIEVAPERKLSRETPGETGLQPVPDTMSTLITSAAQHADFVYKPSSQTRLNLSNRPRVAEVSLATDADGWTVLRLAGGEPAARPGGLTEGYSIRVPDAFELAASGKRVRICVVARGEPSALPTRLAIAYSTNEAGNSGWQWSIVGTEWALLTIEYDVPEMIKGWGDFIGLLPDKPGSTPAEIAMVSAEIVPQKTRPVG